MDGHAITMLGTGLIGDFYTMTLHGQRSRDRSGSSTREARTAARHSASAGGSRSPRPICGGHQPPRYGRRRRGLPNFLHEEAVGLAAEAGKAVLCTKPLGRTAEEARRMLDVVEKAGVFGGYLEDLCYTPKSLKAIASPQAAPSATSPGCARVRPIPGPHSAWFWDGRLTGGGAIIDLGCHCIEIIRNFVGKGNRPVEVMCHTDTLVHPIADEDNAIALIRFESGAIGQFEVSWTFRGGMDLRDEVAGTHGTIWINHFLRTGFEMFSARRRRRLRGREGRDGAGWLFPVGDEVSELGYVDMFSDMFGAIDAGRRRRRRSTTATSSTPSWTPAIARRGAGLGAGRAGLARRHDGAHHLHAGDLEGQVVIKRELLPDGRHKLILKDPATGDFTRPDRRRRLSRARRSSRRGRCRPADWADAVDEGAGGPDRRRSRTSSCACRPARRPVPIYERLPGALQATRHDDGRAAPSSCSTSTWDCRPVIPIRCDSQLRRQLIDRLDRRPARFLAFDVDGGDAAAACRSFDAEIGALGGLDLVILGLGMNGHVGHERTRHECRCAHSRDPNSRRPPWTAARSYGAEPPPTTWRDPGTRRDPRRPRGLVAGQGSAQGRRSSRRSSMGRSRPNVPASLLRGHPGLRVIADDDALPSRTSGG